MTFGRRKLLVVFAWVGALQVVSLFIGLLSQPENNLWYIALRKSPLTPPGIWFAVVWTALYFMLGIVGSLLWLSRDKNEVLKLLKKAFVLQLILNWLWSPLFFRQKLIAIACLDIIMILVITLFFCWVSRKKYKLLFILIIPYVIWLTFAAYLNIYIYIYN